jgi:hypothetical protein
MEADEPVGNEGLLDGGGARAQADGGDGSVQDVQVMHPAHKLRGRAAPGPKTGHRPTMQNSPSNPTFASHSGLATA